MPRTRIKICGVTTPDDALLAAEAGADAVGVILHAGGARRSIDAETALRIVAALPPFVTPVGVFVDAHPTVLRRAAERLGLGHVQLHGREGFGDARNLSPLSVVKAVGPEGVAGWREADVANLAALLLDTGGGTGRENDWSAVERATADRSDLPPLILAGGLTPENVGGVVRRLRPYAVDVSSGVEGVTHGRKDAGKVRAFVAAVREADGTA